MLDGYLYSNKFFLNESNSIIKIQLKNNFLCLNENQF